MLNVFAPFDGKDAPKLSDDDKQSLVDQAVNEWMMYTDQIQEKLNQSAENWQAYLQNTPATTGLNRAENGGSRGANVRTGKMASTIDGMHAQLCLAAFPSGTQFKEPKPRNKIAEKFKQEYERLTQDSAQKLDLLINAYDDVKQLILDGTSACWHPFIRIEKRKASYMFMDGMIDENDDLDDYAEMADEAISKVYRDTVEVEGTGFYPIVLEDWRIDPTVDSLDKTCFLWRRWVYVEDLEEHEDFENTEEVVPYRQLVADEDYRLTKLQYHGIDGVIEYNSHMMGAGESEDAYPANMVCLMEKWGDFYIDGTLYRNHVLIFSNDRTYHYFGPNPYDHQQKPFSVAPFISVPGTLIGKTSITDAIPLLHALDTAMCQALDIMSSNADGAHWYNANDKAVLEWVQQGGEVGPGMLIPALSPNPITPLVANLQGIGALDSLMSRVNEMISDTTGGVPYATGGMQNANDKTLGEVEILASATNSRFQAALQVYEKYRLQRFVLQEFENYRQYMSEPVRIDEEGRQLTPAVVKMMDFDFEITGSRSVLNKTRSLNDMKEALAMIPAVIQSGSATLKRSGKQIDPMPIIEEMFKNLGINLDQVFEEADKSAALGEMGNVEGLPPNAIGGTAPSMAGPPQPPQLPPPM